MIKKILRIVSVASGLLLLSTLGFSQTVINNGNFTFSGLYTPAPPVLDGEATDACWSNATLGGESNENRLGAVTAGVFRTLIAKQNNHVDNGTASGPPPASGQIPSGVSASYSLVWDLDNIYFIVKVVDPRLPTSGASTGKAAIEMFFNNGNGRSAFAPGAPNFPWKYEPAKDMQLIANFSVYSTTATLLKNIQGEFFHGGGGIQSSSLERAAVVKGTSDGYIVEGRIAWSAINQEFLDPTTGQVPNTGPGANFKPSSNRPALGLDAGVNIPNQTLSDRGAQLMWNQCCWNTNWTQSQHFGHLKLVGAPKLFTATGISITDISNNAVSQVTNPGQVLELKATVSPVDASQNVKWSVNGTNGGGFSLASIDNLGKLTPLNNGVVTITASTLPIIVVDGSVYTTQTIANNTTIPSINQSIVITISGQSVVTSVNVTAPGIDVNWGTSAPKASTQPANTSNMVTWSMIDPTGLAKMNTLTGEVTSTALADGVVTVVGTSIVNGMKGYFELPITKQSPIDCFVITSYSNINTSTRTKGVLTFGGFSSTGSLRTRITLRPQYLNKYIFTPTAIANTTAVSELISLIPDDLVSITGNFGTNGSGQIQKAGEGWQISFNQNQARNVTITAIYLNNPTVREVVIASINSGYCTTCSGSGVGFDITNSVAGANPGCGNFSLAITDDVSESTFQLYPNPATESITIAADGITNVLVLNLVGGIVLTSNVVSNSLTLPTSSLNAGVYFVRVKRKGGQVSTQKLIISK